MNNLSLALTAILMLALVVMIAPNILALNRGKVMRNIAIWLAIFAALGLVYQFTHGGGSIKSMRMPLTSLGPAQQNAQPASAADKNDGNQGFTPPKE